MATNVAAVDIGTNSVLLLVAAWDSASGELSALLERARITRLGRGVDRSRRLAPDAVERTLNCLAEFSELIRMHEVQHVDAVGTSAARDAEGAEEFLRAAESILGVRPHIINGQREAALTFEGALCGLDAAGAVVACDIGGGSTEIVLGERDSAGASRLQHAVSVDVGSVRLTERYLTDDPATAAQIGAARQDVRNELRRIERPPAGATFVGLAGTVTTLAAVQLGLERYDPARVHGAKLASVDIVGMRQMLSGLSVGARRGTPGLEPGRADVIVAGAVILEEVLRWAGAEQMLVSDRGVRWGLALERCRTL